MSKYSNVGIDRPECPYCHQIFPKMPQRKTKCPYCKIFFYSRTRPSDQKKVLVTEEQLKILEKDWEIYSATKEFRKYLESNVGFNEKYEKVKENLTKRWGFTPSEGDTLWGTSIEFLLDAMKQGDLQKMKVLYFDQALYLHQKGENHFRILQEVAKCDLKKYQKEGYKKVEILTAGEQSCPACQKLSGKILNIEEALKDLPIPVKNCSFKLNPEAPVGWCRCQYLPVIPE